MLAVISNEATGWAMTTWRLSAAIALVVSLALAGCERALSRPAPENSAAETTSDTRTVIMGVARVTDGDTLSLTRLPVRLWGVDAPEDNQECSGVRAGDQATAALVALAQDRLVVCVMMDWDGRNRRPVATCTVDGRDLSGAMAEQGWAYDFSEYSGGHYAGQEQVAVAAHLGLHAMSCAERPWQYRARLRHEREGRGTSN